MGQRREAGRQASERGSRSLTSYHSFRHLALSTYSSTAALSTPSVSSGAPSHQPTALRSAAACPRGATAQVSPLAPAAQALRSYRNAQPSRITLLHASIYPRPAPKSTKSRWLRFGSLRRRSNLSAEEQHRCAQSHLAARCSSPQLFTSSASLLRRPTSKPLTALSPQSRPDDLQLLSLEHKSP